MKKITFTGGGSAGHVTPNLAIISRLKEKGWEISYIGSKDGIEKEIIGRTDVPYYGISTGKLRRYFDLKNFKDPFKVVKGVGDAYFRLRRLKPDVIFSKGGFVSVPVVIAGNLLGTPVFIHESDITPGLANKIAVKFATKVFVTFEEAIAHLPADKAEHTGSPIREEIFNGSKEKGLEFLGFNANKPVITIMGGSLGSKKINDAVRGSLDHLLDRFQVVHLCGKGNVDSSLTGREGYRQFEYVNEELPDVLAATDLVISRAGSNSIFEFLALRKPMLLIPLSRQASRGDQILNAKSFEKKGFASVLEEEELTSESLLNRVEHLYDNRLEYKDRMHQEAKRNSLDEIIRHIENA